MRASSASGMRLEHVDHERVVHRQSLEHAGAQPVAAAVTDVRHVKTSPSGENASATRVVPMPWYFFDFFAMSMISALAR